MNNLTNIIANELNERNISYATVAGWLNCSKSTVSNYINSKRSMPIDFVRRLAEKLKSARLIVLHTWECSCGLFKTKYLAGVDDHPVTVKNVGINELREAIEAFRALPVENKMRREDFNSEEWDAYESGVEQLCDIHALIEKALESGQKYYGLDIKAMQKRINAKLDARGYTKEKTASRAVR